MMISRYAVRTRPARPAGPVRVTIVMALTLVGVALSTRSQAAPPVEPEMRFAIKLVTDRHEARTTFQDSVPWSAPIDLRTDAAMAYGLRNAERGLGSWRDQGYVPHVMTGIAWGHYDDYLSGRFDGTPHHDEGQVNGAGEPIMHGADMPYMVPAVSFADYLAQRLRPAVDQGARAIFLEEPEFWADGGYSESFKREWETYYGEPWRRPDSSPDAQYRASKLKHYLYQRALRRVSESLQAYTQRRYGYRLAMYVPTHSLINYTHWRIVSPESALIELPGIDGYIAQVWTGTSRTPTVYAGSRAERTFEAAYLEYGVMQELTRGTGRRMWFLHDPIEDNGAYDWDDYRRNYICTLTASLLHPYVASYEVVPWPRRVFLRRYPRDAADAQPIPRDYATVLLTCFNQLRDMEQPVVAAEQSPPGIGVFMADSAMFQRAEPAFSMGLADSPTDATRPTRREIFDFGGFYGLALGPVKHGLTVQPVQLDNLGRFTGYLADHRVLVLSYEYLKPGGPLINDALASWVRQGGVLVYVGADTDPFHQVREWWNRDHAYATPTEHLFDVLDLATDCPAGGYAVGDGHVIVVRRHPAWFSRTAEAAAEWMAIVRQAIETSGQTYAERNYLLLRRGPYVVAACLTESVSDQPLRLQGRYLDLLDAALPVRNDVVLAPGSQAWLVDLDRVEPDVPMVLAASVRVESWQVDGRCAALEIAGPVGVDRVLRVQLPGPPRQVTVDDQPAAGCTWDDGSRTCLLECGQAEEPQQVRLAW